MPELLGVVDSLVIRGKPPACLSDAEAFSRNAKAPCSGKATMRVNFLERVLGIKAKAVPEGASRN
jgi:hypothetical protein